MLHAIAGGGSSYSAGANFETFGQLLDPPGVLILSLDVGGNAVEKWLNGITVNAGKDGFVAPVKGRYFITVASEVGQHATLWNTVLFGVASSPFTGKEQDLTVMLIPPQSVFDSGAGNGITLVYTTYTELDVGGVIQFVAQHAITDGANNPYVADAYCQMEYVGPATSI